MCVEEERRGLVAAEGWLADGGSKEKKEKKKKVGDLSTFYALKDGQAMVKNI